MRLFRFLCCFFLSITSLPSLSVAAPFQGDGKEYLLYVNPTLWLFAKEAQTTVTVRQMTTGQTLATIVLARAGDMIRRDFPVRQIHVTSDKPVFVGSGNVPTGTASNDAFGEYLLSENGTRIGQRFEGYTRSEVIVACRRSAATVVPQVQLTDVTDLGTPNDDSIALTLANATFQNADIVFWHRDNFDDDQIRVTSNLPCSVLIGHRLRTNPQDDFSVLPPSFDPQEEGRSLGKRFFFYAYQVITIIATEDNTQIQIRDLSDNDDTRTITLNRKQFFTTRRIAQTYNGYTQVTPTPANEIDSDFLDVTADKPITIYVGPSTNDVREHSVYAETVPRGNGTQEAYCFVQNGGARDLQIFAANNQTLVTITTMAGDAGDTSILTRIGGAGNQAWTGPAAGPVFWESDTFRHELIHIQSNRPVGILCGDFDAPSWLSFFPFSIPNRPPSIAVQGSLSRTIAEGQTLTVDFVGSDPDGDTNLTWATIGLPSGATFLGTGATRRLTWTPGFTQAGTYSVQITLQDSGSPSRTTTVTLTIIVTDVNRAPTITSTPPTASTEDQPYTYTPVASDPDGDPLTWRLVRAPIGATMNPATGRVTWTPNESQGGKEADFEIEVCDNKTPPACTRQTWKSTPTPVNDPPVIVGDPPLTAKSGTPYVYAPTVTDPDAGSTHRWTLKSGPPSATVDPATGKVSWTPGPADVGKDISFEIEVCDDATPPACVTKRWVVKVDPPTGNRPPTISSTPPASSTEDQPYAYTPTATDPDGDPLTWKITKAPPGATIDPATGKVSWTPGDGDSGKVTDFEIEVCDNKTPPACTRQAWKTTPKPVNDPPVIVGNPPTTAKSGTPYVYAPTVTDPDAGDTHAWTLKSGPPGATVDPATGKVSWTPGPADVGKDVTFEIEVCDSARPPVCIVKRWTVKVEPPGPNGKPSITSQPPTAAFPGEDLGYTPTATDPEGEPLLWTLKNGPPGATVDPTTGKVSWTPSPADVGKDVTFEIEVCDSFTPPNCVTQTIKTRVYQTCQTDPDCPASQACLPLAGRKVCQDNGPCKFDKDCPLDSVCLQGRCSPPACYTQACTQGQICTQGSCKASTCTATTCPNNGSICRPADGTCLKLCNPSCVPPQVCVDGACQIDPCELVDCAGSSCFLGRCLPPECAPTASACKHQRMCSALGCEDDLCKDLTCPQGQACMRGTCQTSTSQEVPIEATAEVTPEKPAEGTTESTTESGTEGVTETTTEALAEKTSGETSGESASETPQVEAADGSVIDKGQGNDTAQGEPWQGTISGGCGCQGSAPSLPIFVLLLGFLLLFWRPRSSARP